MRKDHLMGPSPFKPARRDFAAAGHRIGLAATAVMLAATVVIVLVAPV